MNCHNFMVLSVRATSLHEEIDHINGGIDNYLPGVMTWPLDDTPSGCQGCSDKETAVGGKIYTHDREFP